MDASALAVVAVGFSVFALVVVLAVAVRVGRLLRAYDGLVAGEDGASFSAAVGRQTTMAQGLRREVHALRDDVDAVRDGVGDALRHVAVVRYDAFGDMGGMLSFSAALLDDQGNGLVLTSINGRSETRTYAKGVQDGGSDQALSPEEQEAVEGATSSAPLGSGPA
ncbi:MAG: hypothetical protein JWN08_1053 [Frankiales bacterium]|nr:hypothetical protein [Frankiales bacterium]